eukprot:2604475-Amphidinium_carterae.2
MAHRLRSSTALENTVIRAKLVKAHACVAEDHSQASPPSKHSRTVSNKLFKSATLGTQPKACAWAHPRLHRTIF